MDKNNLGELVDAFLKNKISPEDRQLLYRLMDNDPAIKQLVEESLKTYDFLQYLRYQQIRQQLREIDDKDVGRKKRFPPRFWAFLSLILLALFVTGLLYLIKFYSPESLAIRNIETISTDRLMIRKHAEIVISLNLAEAYVRNHDYENAARIYQPLTEVFDRDLREQAKWNVLMCHLAIEGPTSRWKDSLDRFYVESNHKLKEKGRKLLALINSSFYGFFICPAHDKFSGLKPVLI